MAATKYIGYLGGAAIAAGVGAAIAVAGAATANADAAEPSSPDAAKTEPRKPLDKLANRVEKITDRVTTAASQSSPKKTPSSIKPAEAVVDATQITVRKPKLTPEQFEAQQVERLQRLFRGGKDESVSVAAAEADPDPNNPFRADDPPPVDVPDSVVAVSEQLQEAVGPDLAPYVREGVEQGYRGTQMIPWVNAVVPISKIAPSLGAAINGDTAARQLIVNELIKTTPPGSFVYYGYDLVADLANQEAAGAALKDQAVAGVWDLLDPTGILHPPGESGIGNALGA
jgi:hypothetical protein